MFVYPVPKISQVIMKWCRRASHLGRFTLWYYGHLATQLSCFTLWYYGRLATQLSRFTLWHNRRWASQLAGKFTLWHNARRAKKPGLMHAPGVARIFHRKIWRLNPKYQFIAFFGITCHGILLCLTEKLIDNLLRKIYFIYFIPDLSRIEVKIQSVESPTSLSGNFFVPITEDNFLR